MEPHDMSEYVAPLTRNPDGTATVEHLDHSGTTTPGAASGGVLLACPVCGAQSFWPSGGGADADLAALLGSLTPG
jgi:hypothetical protein